MLGQHLPMSFLKKSRKADFTKVADSILFQQEQGLFQKDLPLYDLGWINREKLIGSFEAYKSGNACDNYHANFWNFWAILGASEFLKRH